MVKAQTHAHTTEHHVHTCKWWCNSVTQTDSQFVIHIKAKGSLWSSESKGCTIINKEVGHVLCIQTLQQQYCHYETESTVHGCVFRFCIPLDKSICMCLCGSIDTVICRCMNGEIEEDTGTSKQELYLPSHLQLSLIPQYQCHPVQTDYHHQQLQFEVQTSDCTHINHYTLI